jgi:ABC-type multidrug transport system fused ATPase/permease subunit
MRPARRVLSGMVALTALGSLVGLVPPLALGALVDDLARGRHSGHAVLAAALIVLALLLEALAFAFSDGLFARATSTLYRDLRVLMFGSVARRPPADADALAGLTARFISDAEALQDLLVAPLDSSVLGLFQLLTALTAVALIYPTGALLSLVVIALTALVSRLTQRPVAAAGEQRQEALEEMSATLAASLSARLHRAAATSSFSDAATRVLHREVRLGWLTAANRYGSAAAGALGPIAVVVLAALQRDLSAGRLLALFLLAERAFAGADSLIDLALDVELVRGAVLRCFELIDGRTAPGCRAGGDVAASEVGEVGV